MSFWNGETLAQQLPHLIDPFDPDQIDCAAYTLRLGKEIYVSPSNSTEALTKTKKTLAENESFVIPPGQFAFLLTEEQVKVPPQAIGFISMKARIKFRGLVNVSGFHVDPGYDGHLVFSVFNAGPAVVHLTRGDDCFLMWYADLNATTQKVRKGPAFNEIASDLINPIAGEVESLNNLASRIQAIEKSHVEMKVTAGVLLTLGLAVLLRGCPQQTAQANLPHGVDSSQPLPAARDTQVKPTDSAPPAPSDTRTPPLSR